MPRAQASARAEGCEGAARARATTPRDRMGFPESGVCRLGPQGTPQTWRGRRPGGGVSDAERVLRSKALGARRDRASRA
eukprot:11206647-Lingulodinium_polyedra.AAC.1